ncbi:MAG: hypothetical protein ABJA11_08075, partial [Pseudolysinimonas sp.]
MTGAGTAIMIAIAAALWFAYFLPTWMRRREYLDTERTATRLQQTLRVMAETAELPDQVRLEATSRDATRHERLLRAEQRRANALAEREVAAVRAATPAVSVSVSGDRARLRRRRARRLASLLLVAATITIVAQLWLVITAGAVPGSWFVLAGGAALGVAGVSVRRRLDASGDQAASVAGPQAATPVARDTVSAPVGRASGWTPVPVPAPLYLSRPEAQSVQPAMDLATQLRAASHASEQA